MIKLIVLDRDGVINEDSPDYIKSPAEWHAISGSLEAIAKLTAVGFKIVVATNQSGIARNYFSRETLNAIHQKMINQVESHNGRIDNVFICPHGPQDNCKCRKPLPGLLLQIATHYSLKPEEILVIGDSKRDLDAAKNFGASAILVKTGNGKQTLAEHPVTIPTFTDLAEAADIIINRK